MSDITPPPLKRRKLCAPDNETPLNINDKNSIKTAGKIEKILLKNILCHASLQVELADCVNLIQGKNGSGKSSIVASVIVGFGGSSQNADKGNSFKNLIQTGKQQALIEIHLNNEGVNAYKKDLYGKTIIVERKLYQNGHSSYRLKDSFGHVISQKKEDLNRLLFRFNIMVDNPVVILSQENAKTFLSNAKPENLFKFYMLSTGMQQLIKDYDNLGGNVKHCDMLLKMKLQNLHILSKDVKEWQRKGHAIQSLDKKKKKVTLLKIEKSVAELNAFVEELSNFKEEHNKCNTRLAKMKARFKLLDDEKKEIDNEKKKREEDSENVVLKANRVQSEKGAILKELGDKKNNYKQLVNDLRKVEKEVALKRKDVDSIRESLSEDSSIAHKLWQEKNENLAEERANLNAKLTECKQILEVAMTHEQNLQNSSEVNAAYEHTKLECLGLNRRIKTLESELSNFRENSNNSLLVFNPEMPNIISDIEILHQRKAFRCMPVGPIGAYIKCIAQDWVHIAEKIIMPVITSFIVCCKEDYMILKDIFKKRLHGRRQPNVIVTKFRDKVHDVSRYIVRNESYQALWSMLEVSNVHVGNVLLDRICAESILLIPTSQEAGQLLKDARSVPPNCKKAYTLRGDLYYPDPKFRIYSGNGGKHTRYLQVSPKEKINELEQSLKYSKIELSRSNEELKGMQRQRLLIEKESQKNLQQQKKYKIGIIRLEKDISDLIDKEELPPPDVFQLQTDLKESVSYLEEIEEKKVKMENKVGSKKEEIIADQERYKNKEAESNECLQNVYKIQESNSTRNARHQKILNDLRRLKEKRVEQQKLVEGLYNTNIKDLETSVQRKRDLLEQSNNSHVQTERKVNEVERELNALVNAISTEESKVGDLNGILKMVQEKSAHFEKIKMEVSDQKIYIKNLNKAMTSRKTFLNIIESFNETYIKSFFNKAIAKRNLKGDLIIDHKAKLLTISVQKSNDAAVSTLQPLSMMSGGEKSFATVSFILALWDIINSPIRILDEFDVFMDDVARKQVTDLMLSSIKEEFQYLFITPLDYSRKASKFNSIILQPPRRNI